MKQGNQTQTKKGWCHCHMRCGVLVDFEGERPVRVRGDSHNPFSRGSICKMGTLLVDRLNHPDRLNFPLKRKGKKGEGKWVKISWEEALDEIAKKLSELRGNYGPETLAFTKGTYRTYDWPYKRFLNLFGSPNVTGSHIICWCPTRAIEFATYGSTSFPDSDNSKCILLCGTNWAQSTVPLWNMIRAAKKRGTKLIVINPRKTEEAKVADMFLQIRPGTDLALMLAWIKIIIEEELYQKEFVNKWTIGFDKLRENVGTYDPQKISAITWVPEEKIVESARMYANTKPASFPWGLGIDKQGINAPQLSRARCILQAITGNLDTEGGDSIGLYNETSKIIPDVDLELNEMLPPSQRKKQIGSNEYRFLAYPGWELLNEAVSKYPREYTRLFPAGSISLANIRYIWEAILTERPYPVKALICQAANPMITCPNVKLIHQALKSENLKLFVVMDYFLTPSAQLADYVLPAADTLERNDLTDPYYGFAPFCVASPKVMEPLYERKDDYYFWKELGRRMGQEEYWPWDTIEDTIEYRLKPLGITFEELKERYGIFGRPVYKKYEIFWGFPTPSGKVELYSTIFEKLGYDPIPQYKEPESPISAPELAKTYPLILVTGDRFMPMHHSEFFQIKKAREKYPDPLVYINPETASSLGIHDEDWVFIENPMGKVKMKAKITADVLPNVVHAQHGWWFPERKGEQPELFGVFESNINVISPDGPEYCSPETGGWPHSAFLCKVELAEK